MSASAGPDLESLNLPARIPLPIDGHLPEICAGLQSGSSLILQAPPGAGKTTRVPPALLEQRVGAGVWIVVQPRRVAVRTTARRMAQELNCALGSVVGYQIRFERQATAATRILVVTEGILIRKLLEDPFLEDVAGVILDEFHERRLETDLALAMIRRIQQTVRPDLKLVVMSATMDAEKLLQYLPDARRIICAVPTHPVSVEYVGSLRQMRLKESVVDGVQRLAARTDGHLLVFLPGVGEIRQVQQLLQSDAAQSGWSLLPLYGDLPTAEQDRVFADSPQRKVILATNVAETSITVPGVTGVVDSGFARISEVDHGSGLNRLMLRPISQASADQRAGRAGRTSQGVCLRLWDEASQRTRRPYEAPEIQRTDLTGVILQLHSWGEADVRAFPWYEPPAETALQLAEDALHAIGALHQQSVTPLGQELVTLPLHPRLARLVLAGEHAGHAATACLLAACLSERDPFFTRQPAHHHAFSDLSDRLEVLEEWQRDGQTSRQLRDLQPENFRQLYQVQQHLLRSLPQAPDPRQKSPRPMRRSRHEAIGRAILAAFPDRVVKRREPGSRRGVMIGGRGVVLLEQSAVMEPELFIALDADAADKEVRVRLASGVEREWLTGAHLTTKVVVEFDEVARRVQARQRTTWFDLVLEESPAPLPGDEETRPILAAAARKFWPEPFPADDQELQSFLARVDLLRRCFPELNVPEWTEATLVEVVDQVAGGCRSLADLKKARWIDALRGDLTSQQLQMLDCEIPERIQVPSGSRIGVSYQIGQPPVLPVRIQEVFGWKATPRIAGGRVKLLLHLLSPNHRPQQITDDLQSFWTTAYQQVRGELRRRYPKHAWPEDPWTATAERRPQRKSSG